MPATYHRPPEIGDERTQLLGWYDLQRGMVRRKCEGLSDDDAHRVVIPTSPLMTIAGIVSHLAWAEDLWFREVLLGMPGLARGCGAEEDAAFRVDGIPLADVLDDYQAACARSDAAIATHHLDASGSTAIYSVGEASLRWIVLHMLEETARHAGHLDIIRESLDGQTG